MGTKTPSRSGRPVSSAIFRKSLANRGSTRPPVSSATREVSSTRRRVRPSRRPRVRDGCRSNSSKSACRGMLMQVVSCSATADAGKGRSLVHRDRSQRVSCREDLQDDVLAGHRGLEDLGSALHDDIEAVGRSPFLEDELATPGRLRVGRRRRPAHGPRA